MKPGETGVLYRQRCSAIRRMALHRFALRLSRNAADGRPFACLVTDDREMLSLQKRYRGKRQTTDVLSFPAPDGGEWLGDLAISYDRARSQAKEFGHTIHDEVSILMLHGVLHLAGMDHEKDSGEMARHERRLRQRFGLPLGLTERSGE